MRARLVLLPALLLLGSEASADPSQAGVPPGEPGWEWASLTSSRTDSSGPAMTDRETDLQTHCGAFEGGLRAVALRLVERKIRGLPYLDLDGLTFAQRTAGEPHVWPRAWVVSGRALDHEGTVKKLDAWRASFHDIGVRRCGIATGFAPDGSEVDAAIALDAVADLGPLPVRVRSGTWQTVDATLLVPATSAHVVIMGPSGEPQPIPSSFDGSRVRARFDADRPGPFTVQIVADVATGPRPVLEAALFADVEPPHMTPNLAAPGESASAGVSDKALALAAMVDALRVTEKLRPLIRDTRLDAVALAHARRMMQAHTLGHDVGDGDPAERLANAGLRAKETGENVAHAQSVVLAHRALYASVSHRENLLNVDFTHLGVAVIEESNTSVWVAEVFSTPPR
jgi:uncharacterized protein YkwD